MVDEAKFDLFQSILEQADSMGLHSDKFEVPEAPAELEPGWYRDGRLDGEKFSHAASGLKTEEVFDFGVWELGKFRLEVELLRDDIDGGGMLRVVSVPRYNCTSEALAPCSSAPSSRSRRASPTA